MKNREIFVLLLLCLSYFCSADEYRIRVGDKINVTMKEDEEVKLEEEVSSTGFVTLPYYGPIKVLNLTESETEDKIKRALEEEFYQKATISAYVVTKSKGYVYVYGAVNNPGKSEIPITEGFLTIVQALTDKGGLSKWGNPDKIMLRIKDIKTEKVTQKTINLNDAFSDLENKINLKLKADDLIFVSYLSSDKYVLGSTEVMVSGKVTSPGVVLFEPGEPPSLFRAILKAGNFNKFADKSKVRIARMKNGEIEITKVDLEKLIDDGELKNDILLKSGDLVIVDESWWG